MDPRSLLAEIALLWFVGPFDLIRIIYANIQNPLCNCVVHCPHIIRAKFRQNPMKSDEEKRNSVKFLK